MSSEAIKIIGLLSFMLVGGGSFLAGYLLRYLLSGDYDTGYYDGFDDGRRIQKELHQLGKIE